MPHARPEHRSLTEEAIEFEGPVVLTEKIDATNARVVCLPDDSHIIRSRDELLLARGDLTGNPALGILGVLRDVADGDCGVGCWSQAYPNL